MLASPRQARDTVSAGFVQGITAGLLYRPGEVAQLLEHAEIASNVLHRAAARVPLGAYTRLYRLVGEHLDDEGFGLFSRALRPGFTESLVQAGASAARLDEALARMLRLVNLVQDNFALRLSQQAGQSHLLITVTRPLPVAEAGFIFAHEWLLRLLHGIAAWLVARPLPLDAASFPYPPPAHASDYERVFAPKISFGDTALDVSFDAALLALPVRRDAAELAAFLAAMPANITMLYRGERSLAPRLRHLLRDALPGAPGLDELAASLHLSARSLHRHLEREGTSLRRLRETLRHELAMDWLAKTRRPIQQIAADLGFADNTSFYRAFRLWTGCGPRAWRQRQTTLRMPGDSSG